MTKEFSEQFRLIQKDRRGVVESSVYPGIKQLVSEIYPEEAHFIYELLQNAEDAMATSVYFEIRDDMLIFRHNGKKQFDSADVDSITNIGKSTKKENFVQAGKFGIGFKSVYAFTETPHIYCDPVCFRIDQLMLPVPIEDIKGREKGWTEFRFPFDSPKIGADDAKKKIKRGLSELESSTLLFLNNINTLSYVLDDKDIHSVVKETDGHLVKCSYMHGKKIEKTNAWLRFTRAASLDGRDIQVDIAFQMEFKDQDKTYDFGRGEDKVCIKFYAKNEKSNLRFCVNAPFGCTPSRDTVNKDDKANKELIRQVSMLMQSAITELREKDLLSDAFFEVLPLQEDNIPEFYQPVVDAIRRSFIDRKNIPTMVSGRYVTAENGMMSGRDVIDKVFTQKDIRFLFQNINLCFVKNRPVTTRAYKFLTSLNIKVLTAEAALTQMTELDKTALLEWLGERNTSKLADLYSFLSKGIDAIEQKRSKYKEHGDDYSTLLSYYASTAEQRNLNALDCEIRRLPLVRITTGEFAVASETYLVEGRVEVPSEYKVVMRDLYKKETAKKFLKAMGVKSFSAEELKQHQYQNEIREMKSYLAGLRLVENQQSADPLEVARKILQFRKTHEMDSIKWGDYRIVCAKNAKGNTLEWHKADECCLDAPLVEETGLCFAFAIHKRYMVAEVYQNLETTERFEWIEFLKKVGVFWKITVEYKRIETGYRSGFAYDFIVPNLKPYLDLQSIALSRFIWKQLSSEGGWSENYGQQYKKKNRNYYGKSAESSVLSILKNTNWVPDREGVFRRPKDVSRTTIDASFVIDETNGFLAAIGFGESAKKREEEERAKREKEFLEQKQQKEAAKLLGFSSPEEVVASRENSKLIDELRKLGIDPEELLANEKKKKEKQRKNLDEMLLSRSNETFLEGVDSDYDPVAIVSNPERRKKKLQAELEEGPRESRERVSVQRNVPSTEEKIFLRNQYNGKCQICQTRIIRKDGAPYFEAINLLDTSVLQKKYLTGLDTGWNSLCLCPNCAASFKYGAVSWYDLPKKVLRMTINKSVRNYIAFPISIQGGKKKLHYSPVHLFSLQTALEHFEKMADNETGGAADEKPTLRMDQDFSDH